MVDQAVRPCPTWGPMTLASLLEKTATNRADAPFLTSSREKTITFGTLQTRVATLSDFLTQSGYGPGDCVVLRQGRNWEGLVALLAAVRCGLNVCLVPEGMSARDVCEGAAALVPKIVIDVGDGTSVLAADNRAMEIAAGLFTVRLAATFGNAPDGMIDLRSVKTEDDGQEEPKPFSSERHSLVYRLQTGTSGRIERFMRTQSALLSQGLANAMAMGLVRNSVLGSAYDPLGAAGLFGVLVPALLVSGQIRLFNPLDPLVADDIRRWALNDGNAVAVLPLALADGIASVDEADTPHSGHQVWITHGLGYNSTQAAAARKTDTYLVDLNGYALLSAQPMDDGTLTFRPGAIEIAGQNGQPMNFGTVSLAGSAEDNRGRTSLTTGELVLEGGLAASQDGDGGKGRRTGVFARVADGDAVAPVYTLLGKQGSAESTAQKGGGFAPVGGQIVSLAAINRCLSLTGRWQDAAAFAVPDAVLGNRIEVAIVPRESNDPDGIPSQLPKLTDVRSMLSDSGIADTALPVQMTFVVAIPRSASGQVVVDALETHPDAKSHNIAPDSVDQAAA